MTDLILAGFGPEPKRMKLPLPPLPDPFRTNLYSYKQMEDFARAAQRIALEEAAKVCDAWSGYAPACAAAIRQLAD